MSCKKRDHVIIQRSHHTLHDDDFSTEKEHRQTDTFLNMPSPGSDSPTRKLLPFPIHVPSFFLMSRKKDARLQSLSQDE